MFVGEGGYPTNEHITARFIVQHFHLCEVNQGNRLFGILLWKPLSLDGPCEASLAPHIDGRVWLHVILNFLSHLKAAVFFQV